MIFFLFGALWVQMYMYVDSFVLQLLYMQGAERKHKEEAKTPKRKISKLKQQQGTIIHLYVFK
jgi:hypothetical protein